MIVYATLSMSAVMGFGPLEEKEATNGASVSLTSSLLKMVALGFLHAQNNEHLTIASWEMRNEQEWEVKTPSCVDVSINFTTIS